MKFIEFADCFIPTSRIKCVRCEYQEPWLDEETDKLYFAVDITLDVFDDHPGYVEEIFETEYETRNEFKMAFRARWHELLELLNK